MAFWFSSHQTRVARAIGRNREMHFGLWRMYFLICFINGDSKTEVQYEIPWVISMKFVHCGTNLFPKYSHFRGGFFWHNAWAAGRSLLGCLALCLASLAAGAAPRQRTRAPAPTACYIFFFFVFLEKYVSKFSLETSSQLLNHKHVPATKHRQSVHTFLHTFSAWRIALF